MTIIFLETSLFASQALRTTADSTGYIGEFEEVDDHRAGKIVIQLNGRLNKCGVISPRFNVRLNEIEKWINQLLPSRQVGFMVLTTSRGIVSHEEARSKGVGGKALVRIKEINDHRTNSLGFLLLELFL